MSRPTHKQMNHIFGLAQKLSIEIQTTAKDDEQKRALTLGVIGMFSSDFKTDSENKAGANNKLVQTVLAATAR